MKTAGIVLCGGRSQRMGRPKPWLPFGKESLLNRVVDRIGAAVSSVVVVAAQGQYLPNLSPTIKIVRDEMPHCGPLGGLAAGLEALAGQCDAAFVSACDSPFVSATVIRKLFDLLGEDVICIPQIGDRLHPLAAVYRMKVAPQVRSNLAQSRLRLLDLIEQVPTRMVSAPDMGCADADLKAFGNMNTPADYERALREAGLA